MPTIKGKAARRFYKNINKGEISEKQKKFLEECEKFCFTNMKGMWSNLKKPHKNRGEKMKYKEKKYPEKLAHKEKTYEINYIQEAEYGKRGELTVAYIIYNGAPVITVAERSPVEGWTENQGKLVSGGRLIKKLKKKFP